jgi:hypothetical protein
VRARSVVSQDDVVKARVTINSLQSKVDERMGGIVQTLPRPAS